MIIEKKTNLYDSIVQIVESAKNNVNLYTRVGVVREVTLPSYTVEMTNEVFDYDTPNESNYLFEVENITNNDIKEGTYVYLTYLSNDYPVIFKSINNDNSYFYATTLLDFSGTTINSDFIEEYNINSNVDDEITNHLNITPDDITLTSGGESVIEITDELISTSSGGAFVELSDKIKIANNSQDLYATLDSLITEIINMVVLTGTGPASLSPTSIAAITALQVQLGQLLK